MLLLWGEELGYTVNKTDFMPTRDKAIIILTATIILGTKLLKKIKQTTGFGRGKGEASLEMGAEESLYGEIIPQARAKRHKPVSCKGPPAARAGAAEREVYPSIS